MIGFFITYKEKLFFVTADHNIHIEDHNEGLRTGIDNVVCILNNIHNIEEFSTLLTTIAEFYYMEKFDFNNPSNDHDLFDVAVSVLCVDKLKAPFFTDNFIDKNGNILVKEGELKFQFNENQLIESNKDDMYFVYRKIRPRFIRLFLSTENTLK
jgi:hypothetical protein